MGDEEIAKSSVHFMVIERTSKGVGTALTAPYAAAVFFKRRRVLRKLVGQLIARCSSNLHWLGSRSGSSSSLRYRVLRSIRRIFAASVLFPLTASTTARM